jgi:ribosomal protein S18 acetylase RimI-like enzyme
MQNKECTHDYVLAQWNRPLASLRDSTGLASAKILMKLLIRKLKKSDIKETSLLYSKVINPSYISYGEITGGLAKNPKEFSNKVIDYFEKYITDSLNNGAGVYVALADKNIVGFVCLEIKETEAGHKECWITDLGVSKLFRRFGIAKNLLQKAYSFGNKNKVKYFFLESGCSNTNAHSLFKKEGFAPLNIIFIKEPIRLK